MQGTTPPSWVQIQLAKPNHLVELPPKDGSSDFPSIAQCKQMTRELLSAAAPTNLTAKV